MKKITLVTLLAVLLTACAAPLGTITVHTVDKNNKLKSPLVNSRDLLNDERTIFKTDVGVSTGEDDVFTIFLTDTYLRYLKDFGGINEVLIVVEFTEAVTGTPDDTIVKILGPYNNIADATRAPLLNKALYGPKKMESDLLTMNVKVYEYDLEENENNAAMLEFIAGSASTLALADPITLGEIKVAKEIAQTLIRTNENDLVVDMDLDFVAGNKKYKNYGTSKVLPLKDSELVIVKQEACRIGTCWSYFSNGDFSPGLITDAVMFIPTFITKATTDVPDYDSLSDFESDQIKVGNDGLTKNDKAFVDKTWLRFSVVKGGDPSLWNARKALYPTEAEINKLLRNPNGLIMENMEAFTSRLEKAQQELKYANAEINLDSMYSNKGIHFIKDQETESTLCLSHSNEIKVKETPSNIIMGTLIGITTNNLTLAKNSACFQLKGTFTKDKGNFQVNYEVNNQLKSYFFPIIVTAELTGTLNGTCTNNEAKGRYKVNIPTSNYEPQQVNQVSLNGQLVPFSIEDSNIVISLETINPTLILTDIFGGQATSSSSGCT